MATPRKRVPATAPKPQDHQQKKSAAARKAEAEDGFVTIEQCGVKLKIPVGENTPIEVMDLYFAITDTEDAAEIAQANYRIIKELLGEKQWQALKAAGANARDLKELDAKVQAATGN
ncbi:hypothetical protein [Mycolicibacterium elephantis]|uniref:hypothetical protein n=1 Tax=Mycolicibacterium elephantis TaxID=81858 RepID=UPI0007E9917E|nr:hypothetical protein [Mycolicibacterium elephantis]OBB20614.1 hypothetical protein A5762_15260 [Mycolicibacterium elephantis]